MKKSENARVTSPGGTDKTPKPLGEYRYVLCDYNT